MSILKSRLPEDFGGVTCINYMPIMCHRHLLCYTPVERTKPRNFWVILLKKMVYNLKAEAGHMNFFDMGRI